MQAVPIIGYMGWLRVLAFCSVLGARLRCPGIIADAGDEQKEGCRGFGSALQAVLRYLGTGLGDAQEGSRAQRIHSNGSAGVSGRHELTPVPSLGRAGAHSA